eukprot:m.127373 g.127373  ORF g.127373 m.127373 type:complete len:231 (-) comp29267_c2_seq1:100-792(-)
MAAVAIAEKTQELKEAQGQLFECRNQIEETQTRLEGLTGYRLQLELQVAQRKAAHRTLITMDTKKTTEDIAASVAADEEKIAQLKDQIANLAASRAGRLEALNQIDTNVDGVAVAGAKQKTNIDIVRYDLMVPNVATGISQDTLSQTPGKGQKGGNFNGPTESFSRSIDGIGSHVSASPYVNPQDYVVAGDRPATGKQSAKFSDWRSPTRNSTRVAQPPGGHSNMQSIFG